MGNIFEGELGLIAKQTIRDAAEKADAKGRYVAASGFLRRGDSVESVAKRTRLSVETVLEIKRDVDAKMGSI